MTDHLSDDEIDRLLRLCENATPGPYRLTNSFAPYQDETKENDYPGAELSWLDRDGTTHDGAIQVWSHTACDDGEFIAAARTALPAALKELREARERIAEVVDICDDYTEGDHDTDHSECELCVVVDMLRRTLRGRASADLQGSGERMKPPAALDAIADRVLSYRPKDKAQKLRKKARKQKRRKVRKESPHA